MMNREEAKVLVLFTLLACTLLASFIPIKLVRSKKRNYGNSKRKHDMIISFLSCFGGGVFLATCLLDLLPEVREKFIQVAKIEGLTVRFPLTEFTVTIGFFIVLIFEQIALSVKEFHEVQETDSSLSVNVEEQAAHSGYRSIGEPEDGSSVIESSVDQNNLEHSVHQDKSSHSPLRSILLVLALSLHSIFEGLAIGLQNDEDDVISIFVAVLIHKTILAFSLGLNLAQSSLGMAAIFRSNILFCVTSPIGIGIGIAVMNLTKGSSPIIASGILQGIACGTFLFVTFFEVLPHEFNNSKHRLLKLLFVIIGFSCICVVIFLHPAVPNPI